MSWMFRKKVELPAYHDRLWKRADMAAWDERWAKLTPQARRLYVENVKAAAYARSQKPFNKVDSFDAGVIRDEIKPRAQGFVVGDEALGFHIRLRALRRFHLLDPANPGAFSDYL